MKTITNFYIAGFIIISSFLISGTTGEKAANHEIYCLDCNNKQASRDKQNVKFVEPDKIKMNASSFPNDMNCLSQPVYRYRKDGRPGRSTLR